MPTYVYECTTCKDTYEIEQRITENALTDCRCGAVGTVKRLIQPVGIAFKGSGFYVTDNAGAKPTEANAPESPCTGEPSSCACSPATAESA